VGVCVAMTMEELTAVVSGGESEQVEVKTTTGQRTDGAKAVCAMLNGAGGFVLFGVAVDGSLRGQEIGTQTIEDLVAVLRRIEPPVLIQPETVQLPNGHSVIVLRVPGGVQGPFVYEGRPYVRHGSTTQVMSQEEYRRRLIEQMHPASRWEIQEAAGLNVEAIDATELTRTVDEAVRRGRMEDPGTREPYALLQGLGVARENRLLNAAAALFCKSDALVPLYSQCLLRMARFRGTTMTEFEDNRQAHGNIFELLQAGQRFLRQHLPVAGRVVPDLFERQDDPLYPPEALREVLVNALCHRDYQIGGGSVSIAIFDDRLEIASTGRLPFGLTVADLQRPHPSRPWNPVIAAVLYRRGLVEQWGRGTTRVRELTARAGLSAPEFEERGGEFVVRFFPTGYVVPRRVDHALSSVEQDVLRVLGEAGPVLVSRVQAALPGVPEATIASTLSALRTLGLVELRGWGRGAKWRLAGK